MSNEFPESMKLSKEEFSKLIEEQPSKVKLWKHTTLEKLLEALKSDEGVTCSSGYSWVNAPSYPAIIQGRVIS